MTLTEVNHLILQNDDAWNGLMSELKKCPADQEADIIARIRYLNSMRDELMAAKKIILEKEI